MGHRSKARIFLFRVVSAMALGERGMRCGEPGLPGPGGAVSPLGHDAPSSTSWQVPGRRTRQRRAGTLIRSAPCLICALG